MVKQNDKDNLTRLAWALDNMTAEEAENYVGRVLRGDPELKISDETIDYVRERTFQVVSQAMGQLFQEIFKD